MSHTPTAIHTPPDVLRHIMSFIDCTFTTVRRARTVCKNWHRALSPDAIASTGGLDTVCVRQRFTHATYDEDRCLLGERTTSLILEPPPYIHRRRYSRESGYVLTITSVQYIMPSMCPNLRALELHNHSLTDDDIIKSLRGAPLLERLTIQDDFNGSGMTDRSIVAATKLCPRLTTVHLGLCGGVTDASIEAVARAYPRLKSLMVYACRFFTGSSIAAVGAHCPELVVLIASGHEIDDNGFRSVARGCPNLEELYLTCAPGVPSAAFAELGVRCPKLRVLGVSMTQIDDAAIRRVAEGCPDLCFLNVEGCKGVSDSSICEVVTRCRELTRLEIGETRVTSVSMQAIAQHARSLKVLNLGTTRSNIPEHFIIGVIRGCPRLISLSLVCHARVHRFWDEWILRADPSHRLKWDSYGSNLGRRTYASYGRRVSSQHGPMCEWGDFRPSAPHMWPRHYSH